MSSEIERKFLLGELPSWLADRSGERISQGYLTNGEGAEIRLRRAGPRTLLTVKTGAGEDRDEVEVELNADLFDSLWPLTEGRRVAKTRLREPLGEDLAAEVDVYDGDLEGLVVAEVEFDSAERSRAFQPPSWLGDEVTGDLRYSNRRLAADGAPGQSGGDEDEQRPSRGFRLKRKEQASDGIRRVVRGRVAKVLEALEVDIERDRAGAIHSARKDLKKIRAVLRLVRDGLGEDLFQAENRRYRAAGRALSGSRDAEVKVQTLDALEDHFTRRAPSASVGGWRRLLEAERDAADRQAGSANSGALGEAIGAVSAGEEAVDSWPLDGDSWGLVGTGLRRSYERGRKAMSRVADDPDPELVHEWRKRAKDLWYQLRLIRRAWPGLLEETVERTHELADLLGDHHDLTVLDEDLAERTEVGSRPLLKELIECRQGELLGAALELGERLYAEKPKAFDRRMRAYWSAWR
jgi:CYTH domain-containing protein/CHAD domain-containing protein